MNPKSLTLMLAVMLTAAPTGDRAKILGGWYAHQEINDGQEFGSQSGASPSAEFKANGRLWLYGHEVGRYTMDESKKTIDLTMEQGFDSGKVGLGIYKFEGETLTICFTESPAKRPADFTPGAGRYLTVYKREPKK